MSTKNIAPNMSFMNNSFNQNVLLEHFIKDLYEIYNHLLAKDKEEFKFYVEAFNLIKTGIDDINETYQDDSAFKLPPYPKIRAKMKEMKKEIDAANEFMIDQLSKNTFTNEQDRKNFIKKIAPEFQEKLKHPLLKGLWKMGGPDSCNSEPELPKVTNESSRKFVELLLIYLKGVQDNIKKFSATGFLGEGPVAFAIYAKGGIAKVVTPAISKIIVKLEKRLNMYKNADSQSTSQSKTQEPTKASPKKIENTISKPEVEPEKPKSSKQIDYQGIEFYQQQQEETGNEFLGVIDSILDQFEEPPIQEIRLSDAEGIQVLQYKFEETRKRSNALISDETSNHPRSKPKKHK